jgi:mRNA-degrading endonuclease toxin of MazEF toxin-antitoxin module
LLRIALPASEASGLVVPSWAQIDKILTIGRRRIGGRLGHLHNVKMFEIGQALLVFLGIADAAGH